MNTIDGQNYRGKSILMVSDDFIPSATGVGIHLSSICKGLVDLGHSVTVLTSRQPGQPPVELWQGIKVCRCPAVKVAGFFQAIPSLPKVRTLLRDNNIDVIHFHYFSLMLGMVHLGTMKFPGAKIYTYHMTEDVLTQPLLMRPFRSIIGKLMVRFSNTMDAIITPSKALKSKIVEAGVSSKVHYISNPISSSLLEATDAGCIRSEAFQILYVGRLNREKNIPLLIRAFAMHAAKYPQSALWIAGVGSELDNLKRIAIEQGILEKIVFLGFVGQQELAKYYRSCDVFVLPSVVETQGLVVLEAMSFGKPVIVTNKIAPADELVETGSNGFIVDAVNPGDLAARLEELSLNEEKRASFGASSRARVESLDVRSIVASLEAVYQNIDTEKP